MAKIATTMSEQTAVVNQINCAVGQLENVNQQDIALVEESSALSYSLSDQTKALKDQISFFKVTASGIHTPSAAPLRSEEQVFGKQALTEMTTPVGKHEPAPVIKGDDDWQEF